MCDIDNAQAHTRPHMLKISKEIHNEGQSVWKLEHTHTNKNFTKLSRHFDHLQFSSHAPEISYSLINCNI